MFGASLLYNLQLSEIIKDKRLVTNYRGQIEEWLNNLPFNKLHKWKLKEFWDLARSNSRHTINQFAERFVEKWIKTVLNDKGQIVEENSKARKMIFERETRLKYPYSRFENEKARAQWSGQSGINQIDFRWDVAKRFILEIQAGLKRGN